MRTSFHKSKEPIKVGSFMRNSGNGQRIMVVTHLYYGDGDHEPDIAYLRSYGKTNKGDFQLATKPRTIACHRSQKFPSMVTRDSGGMYCAHYYHVIRKDASC